MIKIQEYGMCIYPVKVNSHRKKANIYCSTRVVQSRKYILSIFCKSDINKNIANIQSMNN